MYTQGQVIARTQEYELRQVLGHKLEQKSAQDYVAFHQRGQDIPAMESTGLLFRRTFDGMKNRELTRGKVYKLYGSSVSKKIQEPIAEPIEMKEAEYLWSPIEGYSKKFQDRLRRFVNRIFFS